MNQEGSLGDWRLKFLKKKEDENEEMPWHKKEDSEETPWYSKPMNGEWVDLIVLRVKSPGDLCVIPKALRAEAGRIQEEVFRGRGSSLTSVYLGQRVAAPVREGKSWARGEVVEIGSSQVKVFLIDLGEQRLVRQEDLRELPEHLTRKPPLVLRTGLANISPPSEGSFCLLHNIHSHSFIPGAWSKETCRRLKTLVRDAMEVKGSIQGQLHQVESLPWPLLDLKSEVGHINAMLTEKVDPDLSTSSLLNICHTSPLDSRNKQRPQVEGVKEVSKLVPLTSSTGEEKLASRPNLPSIADKLDEMLGLVEQIKSTAWQKIRGEEEGGHKVSLAALQQCLASLELGANTSVCSTQDDNVAPHVTANRRDTDSTKCNGEWCPSEAKVMPVMPPQLEKLEREFRTPLVKAGANLACTVKDNRLIENDVKKEDANAKSEVKVMPCKLHSGERDEKVTVHLLRFEEEVERWCSSINFLPVFNFLAQVVL